MPAVLFVLSSAGKTHTGTDAGWYLPEAAHPYYILLPYVTIDFAAPKGPNPAISVPSVEAHGKEPECAKFLVDPEVQSKLENAKKLSEVNVNDYDAIFYVGGHGPCIDLAVDEVNATLASDFWKAGKIVSAVCHGPAALIGAKDADGKSIFAGRNFSVFSNDEEKAFGGVNNIPWSVQDKLEELGGTHHQAGILESKVVVDGQLITGQNPASAPGLAEAILVALKLK